ncbi:hypothetical protein C3L33_08692, partial [Rhododendron williamsianum]
MGSRGEHSMAGQQQLQNAHVEDEEGNPRALDHAQPLSIMAEDGEETSLPISAHPPLMFSFNERAIRRMLEESPSAAKKRERLNKSIKLLKDSKEVVAQIIDRSLSLIKAKTPFLSLLSRRCLVYVVDVPAS